MTLSINLLVTQPELVKLMEAGQEVSLSVRVSKKTNCCLGCLTDGPREEEHSENCDKNLFYREFLDHRKVRSVILINNFQQISRSYPQAGIKVYLYIEPFTYKPIKRP